MVHPGAVQRLDAFPNAPHPAQAAAQAVGDIGPQGKPDIAQRIQGVMQAPQLVQPPQHRRGVAAAAAQARAGGDALAQADLRPLRAARVPLQGPGGAQGQVILAYRHPHRALGAQGQALRRLQVQGIVQRYALHHHIQQVVSILPDAHGIQTPVDLGIGA